MNDELRAQLDALERAVVDLEQAARRALGFVSTIEYKGVSFNVSRRFVIADLSPLAFFHLVEHIDAGAEHGDGAADAVARLDAVANLYDRLLPLLSCRHQWTPLSRTADEHLRSLGVQRRGSARPHICKACTAYALEGSLPEMGRTLP